MRHGKKVKKLGMVTSHRKAMLRNMLTSLYKHKRIVTTETKAKFAKPFAEKMITRAMKGDLASKRMIISFLMDRTVAHDLINDIAFWYKDLPTGGYTRILKMGERQGDGARMAILELVDPETRKKSKKSFSKQTEQIDYSSENQTVTEESVENPKDE